MYKKRIEYNRKQWKKQGGKTAKNSQLLKPETFDSKLSHFQSETIKKNLLFPTENDLVLSRNFSGFINFVFSTVSYYILS